MTESVSPQHVVQALQASWAIETPQKERAKYNEWLSQFQKSVQAWEACNALLNDTSLDNSIHIFCAQTMKSKVQLGFHELSPESRHSLRATLVGLIMAPHLSGSRRVVVQLTLALASLAVQMVEWQDILGDMSNAFTNSPVSMIEFLTVFPEVGTERKIPLSDARRDSFGEYVDSSAEGVINLLSTYMVNSGNNSTIQLQIFRAYKAWLRYGRLEPSALANSPLLPLAFEALKGAPDLFDIASDVCCELVKHTANVDKYAEAVLKIFPLAMALGPSMVAVATDPDKCHGYVRIFSEMGEAYLDLVLRGTNEGQQLVNVLMQCSSHNSYKVSELSFIFWYHLTRCINGSESKAQLLPVFQPVFEQVLVIMVNQAMYPMDESDVDETFKEHRGEIADVIRDLGNCGDGNAMGVRLWGLMQEKCNECMAEQQQTGTFNWRPVEAVLFSLRIMSKYISTTDEQTVPFVVDFVNTLPRHPRLVYQGLLTVGGFADWINKHPDKLPAALDYIVPGFETAEGFRAAAQSLHHLVDACAEKMLPYSQQLINLFQSVVSTERGFEPTSHAWTCLVQSIACVLSVGPRDVAVQNLGAVIAPFMERAKAAAEAVQQGMSAKTAAKTVMRYLDIATSVFDAGHISNIPLQDAHPAVSVVTMYWPTIQTIMTHMITNEDVMCTICDDFLKAAMKSAGPHCAKLLQTVLPNILEAFRHYPYGCFVFVAAKFVAHCAENTQVVGEILANFSTETFKVLSDLEGYTNNPQVVVEYIELVITVLRRQPSIVVGIDGLLQSIVSCAFVGLKVKHPEACNSVLALFDHIVCLAVNDAPRSDLFVPLGPNEMSVLQSAIMTVGPSLVGALVELMIEESTVRYNVSLLFRSMLLACREPFTAWLGDAVAAINPNYVHPPEKGEFMQAVLTSERTADVSEAIRRLRNAHKHHKGGV